MDELLVIDDDVRSARSLDRGRSARACRCHHNSPGAEVLGLSSPAQDGKWLCGGTIIRNAMARNLFIRTPMYDKLELVEGLATN
jgi:hypothetical protein